MNIVDLLDFKVGKNTLILENRDKHADAMPSFTIAEPKYIYLVFSGVRFLRTMHYFPLFDIQYDYSYCHIWIQNIGSPGSSILFG